MDNVHGSHSSTLIEYMYRASMYNATHIIIYYYYLHCICSYEHWTIMVNECIVGSIDRWCLRWNGVNCMNCMNCMRKRDVCLHAFYLSPSSSTEVTSLWYALQFPFSSLLPKFVFTVYVSLGRLVVSVELHRILYVCTRLGHWRWWRHHLS